jgi:hypothetical protein
MLERRMDVIWGRGGEGKGRKEGEPQCTKGGSERVMTKGGVTKELKVAETSGKYISAYIKGGREREVA